MKKKVVCKVGSALLLSRDGKISQKAFDRIAEYVSLLRKEGWDVILVSSGAILMGMKHLKINERPQKVEELQLLAAVGQPKLMAAYERCLKKRNLTCAQILLTHFDFEKRSNFMNARKTLLGLIDRGIVPVVNENDSVAVEEIKLGDNDTLSALVASAVDANALLLLSTVSGVIDPSTGSVIKEVKNVDELMNYDTGEKTSSGVGGLSTKLKAAKILSQQGIPVYFGSGYTIETIKSFLRGNFQGTVFFPEKNNLRGRKRWLFIIQRSKGKIYIDEGAVKALTHGGKSLLPGGIKGVEGSFSRGDVVDILDENKNLIGRGITSYSDGEIKKIKGKKTGEIVKILGYKYSDEVVHRNDMVILKKDNEI